MRSGELAVVVEIPPGFGRDLTNLHSPEAGLLSFASIVPDRQRW